MSGIDIAALRDATARHGRVARIVIAGHKGSVPRETGTSMLVWDAGQSGTIGGGALEFRAIGEARRRLVRGAEPFSFSLPLGPGIGQCCGGSVNLVVETFDRDSVPDPPPAGIHARPVQAETAACATASPPPRASRRISAIREGTRARATCLVDGWLIEPVTRPERDIRIYGAGHVGRSLVGALSGLPFAITWFDLERERFPERVPPGVRLLVLDDTRLDSMEESPPHADHLVMTRSHAVDLAICDRVLRREFRSLGLIGSRTKRRRFANRLRALGHTDERIGRLTCPIGMPELGKHPRAIALGVAVALMTNGEPGDGERKVPA